MEQDKQTPENSSNTPEALSKEGRLAAAVKLNALLGRIAESLRGELEACEDHLEVKMLEVRGTDGAMYDLAAGLKWEGKKDSTGSWLAMNRRIVEEDRSQYLSFKIEETGLVSGCFVPDIKETSPGDFMYFEASPSEIDEFSDMLESQCLIQAQDLDAGSS